ncbi:hypothetical protein BAE44_0017182 [Dichanthelium oligosanthes]|uniref:DUF7595 domain-containing protein n=1 Tax=Dichanthelium oligosanthes TaxID=888268 RepID=A0A1E5V9I7_9POAL|nr:hypothetical protein BAE44_0017182 [Dichanthelium oligosanthes]
MHHMNGGGGDLYHILTYNVGTATAGSIKLPMNRLPKSYRDCYGANLRLASSPDGTRLTMFVGDGLRIFVWQHSAGAGWARHAVIDLEETGLLRSLVPEPEPSRLWLQYNTIQFLSSWERSGVVLFYLGGYGDEGLIALDVETKEIHRVDGYRHIPFFPFEVDLESRLSAMKTF